DDVSTVDLDALSAAVTRGGTAVAVDAGDLATVRDGLLAAGVEPMTPVAVTGDGTGETQYTTSSTVDSVVAAALGFSGRVVLTVGTTRSEEHTSELQSMTNLVCRLLLEKKKLQERQG